MADGSAAPGEVKIDLNRLNSNDMHEAGEALAGLFDPPQEADPEIRQEVAREDDQPADDAAEETPPSVEDDDGHSGPDESRATEPPVSWTADEKQLFAQLPPALQQTLARRESERERLTQTQTREASERQKAVEAERQELTNIRAQQANATAGLLLQLYPEIQRFQNVDWDRLAAENAPEWARQQQAFQSLQARIGTAQQRLQQLQEAQQNEAKEQHRKFVDGERQRLVAAVPEFADNAKFRAFGQELLKYLPEISAQELGNIADHRQLLVARDAMLYRKAQALRAEAQAKRVTPQQAAAQPPRRLAPAPRRSSAAEEARTKQLGGLHETLRKSGNMRDAAAFLEASGIFGNS